MRIAKAIILAGEQCHAPSWPVGAAPGPRQLFPLANRPILFHYLESLRRGGLLEATILTDERSAGPIRRAVGDGRRWNLAIRYDACPESEGLAGALATCRSFIGEEPVLVQQADALLRGRLMTHISAFTDEHLDAMALHMTGETGSRQDLPPGYLLSPRALEVLRASEAAAANPIGEVRASGGRVRVESVDGCLPCHGDVDALLAANRRLLQQLKESPPGDAVLDDCEIQGPVVVHPSAEIRRSTLRGPAIIGPGARLNEAYVGPYTSIGADVRIEGSEIEYSIVLPGAELSFVGARVESSVIGERARVSRAFRKPSSLRLTIGDGSEILLS